MIAPATPLYVLDTNILIAYIRGGKLGQRIEATYQLLAASRPPLISIVTEGEVRSLAQRNNWGAAKQQQMENLLGTLLRVSLDAPRLIAAYADIDAYSERRGRSMGKNDVWIAATANVTTATLLTTDKDFDHLDPSYLSRVWIDPKT